MGSGQAVALKKCQLENYKDTMGEIEILRECDHPNIVKYFGNQLYEEFLWVKHNSLLISKILILDCNGIL